VEAAGGLIRNPDGEVLFMFRRGNWDLPKGKRDSGESIQECSLREVREETGLIHITLLQFLLITRHVYEEKGRKYLKETSWFAMTSPGRDALIPQLDEQITELRWVSPRMIPDLLANSFPSIRDVLTASGIAT
jgi:8-oxo-dGTP pyrophosphatase MutT (NUDIX family)